MIYKTNPEGSEGHLNLTYIIPVASDSITLIWTGLSNHSGSIEKYVLSCTPVDRTEPCVSYEGPETSATIRNLVPFTQYCFSVQGCTNGSCLYSSPITVTTAQAPPQRQEPPTVWKISPTELKVEWSRPVDSNGKSSRLKFIFLLEDQSSRNEVLCRKTGNCICLDEYKTFAWEMLSEDKKCDFFWIWKRVFHLI